jgi:hypothetical protein
MPVAARQRRIALLSLSALLAVCLFGPAAVARATETATDQDAGPQKYLRPLATAAGSSLIQQQLRLDVLRLPLPAQVRPRATPTPPRRLARQLCQGAQRVGAHLLPIPSRRPLLRWLVKLPLARDRWSRLRVAVRELQPVISAMQAQRAVPDPSLCRSILSSGSQAACYDEPVYRVRFRVAASLRPRATWRWLGIEQQWLYSRGPPAGGAMLLRVGVKGLCARLDVCLGGSPVQTHLPGSLFLCRSIHAH